MADDVELHYVKRHRRALKWRFLSMGGPHGDSQLPAVGVQRDMVGGAAPRATPRPAAASRGARLLHITEVGQLQKLVPRVGGWLQGTLKKNYGVTDAACSRRPKILLVQREARIIGNIWELAAAIRAIPGGLGSHTDVEVRSLTNMTIKDQMQLDQYGGPMARRRHIIGCRFWDTTNITFDWTAFSWKNDIQKPLNEQEKRRYIQEFMSGKYPSYVNWNPWKWAIGTFNATSLAHMVEGVVRALERRFGVPFRTTHPDTTSPQPH